jgi:hypothetical protein
MMTARTVTLQDVRTYVSSKLREYAKSIQKEMREEYGYETTYSDVERTVVLYFILRFRNSAQTRPSGELLFPLEKLEQTIGDVHALCLDDYIMRAEMPSGASVN